MKKIKILCDPMLTAMGATYTILTSSLCLYFILDMMSGEMYGKTEKDSVAIFWIYVVMFIINLAACLGVSNKWFARVVLDKEGIRLNTPFKKGGRISYSEYFYFQIGYYIHIVQPRIFVVISKKGLSPKQIVNINSVGISENTVKISLNKRRAKMLLEVLPEWQKNKLQRALNGELEEVGIDLSKAEEPDTSIKRRKKKKTGKMYKHKKK